MTFKIKPITAQETLDLRHRILRPHQTITDCIYSGDDDTRTIHLGVFDAKDLVGICSAFPQDRQGNEHPHIYRIRGVAIDQAYQGQGLGRDLMAELLLHLKEKNVDEVWCNARKIALTFYKKIGFQIDPKEFDIPGIGSHFVAHLNLSLPIMLK